MILNLRPNNNVRTQQALKLGKKWIEPAISRNGNIKDDPLSRTEFVRLQGLVELNLKFLDLKVVMEEAEWIRLHDFYQQNSST